MGGKKENGARGQRRFHILESSEGGNTCRQAAKISSGKELLEETVRGTMPSSLSHDRSADGLEAIVVLHESRDFRRFIGVLL